MILKTWSGSYIDTKEYSGAWIYRAWAKGWVLYAWRRMFGKWRRDEDLPPCKREDEDVQ